MKPAREHIDVAEISADASGRLVVAPAASANTNFSFIYRAGMEVAWNPETRSLVGGVPRAWSRARWFEQIAGAVKGEYGLGLRVTLETKWIDIPDEDRREIETWSRQA